MSKREQVRLPPIAAPDEGDLARTARAVRHIKQFLESPEDLGAYISGLVKSGHADTASTPSANLTYSEPVPTEVGYGTGDGSSVTQTTSRSTAVTINTLTGQITTTANSMASGSTATFTVNNSQITAHDVVVVNASGSSDFKAERLYVQTGSFAVQITNISGGTATTAAVINFVVLRGASS